MVEIPDYENYSLLELYQVLNGIRADLYPDVYAALLREIDGREPSSVGELEDCYFALDRQRNPEFEARLRAQIERLGGFQLPEPEEIAAEYRYRTFWRRFWAHILDSLVIGLPLGLMIIAITRFGLIKPEQLIYAEQFLQIVTVGYYIAMHAKFGQTVGKMATGVKVLDVSEEHGISWRQSVVRDIVPVLMAVVSVAYLLVYGVSLEDATLSGAAALVQYAISIAALVWVVAELLTMLFSRKRRAVHDLLARTVVVRVAA